MPILDRRDHNRLILIAFNGQESFQDAPISGYVSLNMVSNGEYVFLLCGKSGSGKSTLLSLLAKMHPYERGHILINDGVELSTLTREEWYQKISCQLQEMTLFPETIRENLYYAKPDASEQEMKEALQAADAWGFVSEMPNGLDSKLSENASDLSGGQRQRILLARTLLKRADVYFLDEPTSALDRRREIRVMETLKKLAETKLVFVITHQEEKS